MGIKLEITAESVVDFDELLARFTAPAEAARQPLDERVGTPEEAPVGNAEAPTTAPRKRRTKEEMAAATAPALVGSTETQTSASADATAAENSGSAASSDEPDIQPSCSVQDLLDKASTMLSASPAAGAAIQDALEKAFNVRSLKKIDPADFDKAMGILEGIEL